MDISSIIKVTNNCNLHCKYCNYTLLPKKPNNINMEIINKFIYDFLSIKQNIYEFEWHGGEPTLLGIKFFQECIKLQNKYKQNVNSIILNTIQTNATLINQEWIDFFKENNFSVGVSFDGCKIIQNKIRTFKNNQESYDIVTQNIKNMIKAGLDIGILIVVSKESIGYEKQIYNNIRNNINIKHMDFLLCEDETLLNKHNYFITPMQYITFIKNIFNYWVYEDNPDVYIRCFNNTIEKIFGETYNYCFNGGMCHKFITLDVNGDIYNCERTMNLHNVNKGDYKLGNIIKNNLYDILNSDKYKNISIKLNNKLEKCNKCEINDICNGGCYFYRYNNTQSEFCFYYKELFKIVYKFVQSNVKL